ncbi:MAG TPA: hypothetical protein PKO06_15720, partial [Candidatus Ozemobacteraceae bacterium]|nr:hypothetical protein [Candidatus Ozemobacteraceae bacterium]
RVEGVRESQNTLCLIRSMLRKGLVDTFGLSITTPYPGSDLYDLVKKWNVLRSEFDGNWEKWNNVWDYALQLPGILPHDVTRLKVLGSVMQALALLKSGTTNWKSLHFLFGRSWELMTRTVRTICPW